MPSPKPKQPSDVLENSSHKRSVELLLRDSQKTEMAMLQRSPKIQKRGNLNPLTPVSPGEGGRTVSVHETQKWTDVCRFSFYFYIIALPVFPSFFFTSIFYLFFLKLWSYLYLNLKLQTYNKFCEDTKALVCGSAGELSCKMVCITVVSFC